MKFLHPVLGIEEMEESMTLKTEMMAIKRMAMVVAQPEQLRADTTVKEEVIMKKMYEKSQEMK